MKIQLTEAQMDSFGEKLGHACLNGSVIYLYGTLGMGKTTLSRGVVIGLGWSGRVKSPTYNLVEHYELSNIDVLHFDLYRLADPEELEYLGVRDFDEHKAIWLIEWAEKGFGMLPTADITIMMTELNNARILDLTAQSDKGLEQLKLLGAELEAHS